MEIQGAARSVFFHVYISSTSGAIVGSPKDESENQSGLERSKASRDFEVTSTAHTYRIVDSTELKDSFWDHEL
jgi:hypothetical protein